MLTNKIVNFEQLVPGFHTYTRTERRKQPNLDLSASHLHSKPSETLLKKKTQKYSKAL